MARLEATDSGLPNGGSGGGGDNCRLPAEAGRRAAAGEAAAGARAAHHLQGRDAQRGAAAAVASSPVAAELGPIEAQDIRDALAVTKASARQYEKKYTQFSEDYGRLGS